MWAAQMILVSGSPDMRARVERLIEGKAHQGEADVTVADLDRIAREFRR
jgi:hypothetical protein